MGLAPCPEGGTAAASGGSVLLSMLTIESILCPVDLSHDSADALRYALTLARAYDAKLYLCPVFVARPLRPAAELARAKSSAEGAGLAGTRRSC